MNNWVIIISLLFSNVVGIEKININYSSESELEKLPITKDQIKLILFYKDNYGILTNIYELKNIDKISIQDIHDIRKFVTLATNKKNQDNQDKNYDYKVSQWLTSDSNSESLSESWLDRYFQPMNVNDMSYDDLMSLPNISPLDAIAVLKQKNRGYINGTFELKNSPGISRWGYKNLKDFISYESKKK